MSTTPHRLPAPLRRTALTLALASLAAASAAAQTTAPAAPPATEPTPALRVCADPDNLPYTKAEGPERGLYVEVAELVARQLQTRVEYTWWYTHNQRRALRNTIAQDACDVTFLPATADYKARGLEKTQPFIDVAYAIVAPAAFRFASMDDLRPRKIGVQFRSTPQIVLATEGGFNTVTFLKPDEIFAALDKGEIDAAFMWGPEAGYLNQRRDGNRYSITPVSGHSFDGQMSIAVRRDKAGLADRVNAALSALKPQIQTLAGKYGFPTAQPVQLNAVAAPARNAATATPHADLRAAAVDARGWPQGASADGWRTVKVASHGAAPVPAAGDVSAGRTLLNGDCSHCHGAGGMSPVVERDMRRMKRRYDAKWEEVARNTILNGRPEAGMPVKGGMANLSDQDITNIIAYLRTIQRD